MAPTSEQHTARLASFAASLHLSAIPHDFLELLPIFMLDSASAMLCGAVQPVFQAAVRMINITHGSGGHGDKCSAMDGTKTSLSGAAFLNGVAAGNFEFEHVMSTTHPASAMFPALLTVAAAYHKTGEELLAAMAVGYELSTRIGFACTKDVEEIRGFHNPGLNGHLATAAAVGRLMDLDASTIASAMGIAASSSAGLMAFANTGAMTKRLHPARSGQLGVEAAFLAKEGVAGPLDILETPGGFLHAFSPKPESRVLTSRLGREWTSKAMMLKLSPVHMRAQAFVHAINNCRDKQNKAWTAKNIESVTVYGGSSVLKPPHMIRLPESLVSAQYSIPFSIAAALTVDLRNPMRMNDDLVSDALTRSVSEHMRFVLEAEDTQRLTGTIVIQGGGHEISIDAGNYPGLPGSTGYVEAAVDKYERVITSLGVTTKGMTLRTKIEAVAKSKDVSELLDAMIEAGAVACRNNNSGEDSDQARLQGISR